MNTPLAERLRPTTLSDYISQQHLVGPQGALTQGLKQGLIPSMILWGPPGIGKTTLATIIAKTSDRPFYTLSAINSGVKDVREVIEKAKKSGGLFTTKNPILFIDEIHTIIGAGSVSGGVMDASNLLKPALTSGNIFLASSSVS